MTVNTAQLVISGEMDGDGRVRRTSGGEKNEMKEYVGSIEH